jgi:hypothetical protein
MSNLVVYSLWGDKPMYWIGAIRNIELVKKYLPGWVCRFYIDKNCNPDLIDTIKGDNVEVILLESNKNQKTSNIERFNHSGLFWRFLALSQKYDTILFRDCDSRITERESIAINEWLESDKEFHIMRDHPYHSVPILSGMWGCKKNSLLNINDLMNQWNEFPNKGKYQAEDQDFLGQIIYPLISNKTLEHSEFGISYGQPIHKFSKERESYEFVGDVFDENEQRHPEYWKIIKNIL